LLKDAKAITVNVIIDIYAVTDAGGFPVNSAKAKICHIPPSHKNATDRGSTDVYGDNGCTCLVFL
jgi:hypothetical protein